MYKNSGPEKREKRRRRQRGQSALEFGLILPILIAVAGLAIDLANMVYITHRLSAGTREGARVATETSLPLPSTPNTCSLATCPDATDISGLSDDQVVCCVAVGRTSLVIIDSGVMNAEVTGTWEREMEPDRCRWFLRVHAQAETPFFFRLGSRLLESNSVAFADELPLDDASCQ